MAKTISLDSRSTVIAAVWFTVVGASAFLILPLLVGAAAMDFQLDESELGFLSGIGMAGSAISAIAAIFWVRRINWRVVMFLAMLVVAAGHCFAILTSDYSQLLLAIFVVSLGGGTAYSLALTILSDNEAPDRVFGFSVAAQVSFQVLGLLTLPALIEKGGLDALLAILGALAVLSLIVVWFLPVAGKEVRQTHVFQIFSQPKVVYALFGCLFFFFNVGCFWTFIERMGDAAGYSPQVIGNSLAAGVSTGVIGSLCASRFGDKYGRLRPLLLSSLGTVVAALLLVSSDALVIYVLAIALYNFVWNYSLAYQYAVSRSR